MARIAQKFRGGNSIAFGSAPRREADSQPISQLGRPAVSQTEAHSLGFLSVADSAASSGEEIQRQGKQWLNGNAADRRLLGRRFQPRPGEHGGAVDDSRPSRSRAAELKFRSGLRYHSTKVGCHSNVPPHCLEPSKHKLLTPTPPLKKVIPSFRG